MLLAISLYVYVALMTFMLVSAITNYMKKRDDIYYKTATWMISALWPVFPIMIIMIGFFVKIEK